MDSKVLVYYFRYYEKSKWNQTIVGSKIKYLIFLCRNVSQSCINRWYLNSGCSRHMTGDKLKFCLLIESDGGKVTFGGNFKGKIIGSRKVGKNLSSCIDDVMLVEGLAYNLLSISQLCDKGHRVLFDNQACTIYQPNSKNVKFTRKRVNNMYMIDLDDPVHENLCLTVNKDNLA